MKSTVQKEKQTYEIKNISKEKRKIKKIFI